MHNLMSFPHWDLLLKKDRALPLDRTRPFLEESYTLCLRSIKITVAGDIRSLGIVIGMICWRTSTVSRVIWVSLPIFAWLSLFVSVPISLSLSLSFPFSFTISAIIPVASIITLASLVSFPSVWTIITIVSLGSISIVPFRSLLFVVFGRDIVISYLSKFTLSVRVSTVLWGFGAFSSFERYAKSSFSEIRQPSYLFLIVGKAALRAFLALTLNLIFAYFLIERAQLCLEVCFIFVFLPSWGNVWCPIPIFPSIITSFLFRSGMTILRSISVSSVATSAAGRTTTGAWSFSPSVRVSFFGRVIAVVDVGSKWVVFLWFGRLPLVLLFGWSFFSFWISHINNIQLLMESALI